MDSDTADATERNIGIVRKLYASFSKIDPIALTDLFADDAYVQPIMKEPYRGRDEILRMFTIWSTRFSRVETPLRNVVGQGDVVMVEWSDESDFGGERTVLPCVGGFEFVGAKIKSWRLYYDNDDRRSSAAGLHVSKQDSSTLR